MVTLNFPQSNAQLTYDGQWHVSKQEGLQLPVVNVDTTTMTSYDLVHSALTLQLVLGIAESYSDREPIEAPDKPTAVFADWVAFDNSKPKRYPTFYNGSFISYEDVDVTVSEEMLYNWYMPFLPATSPLYHDFYKPVVPNMWAYRATVTRQCVEYDNGMWKSVSTVNTGWEKTTSLYGYEVYTNNPEVEVPPGGIDALAIEVAHTYPVAMLSTVPEYMFEDLPPSFNTNAHRLLYYLNAGMMNKNKKKPEQKQEPEPELPEGAVDVEEEDTSESKKPDRMSIVYNTGSGAVLSIGGDIKVEKADGVWETENLAKFLKEVFDDFSTTSVEDNKLISKYASDSYYAVCSEQARSVQVGGAPDLNVRIQVHNSSGRYVWTGAVFRPMFGSERSYSKSITVYDGLTLSYEDGQSTLTTKYVEHLFCVFLSMFCPADERTMQLYYKTHILPDKRLAFAGNVLLADDYTSTYQCLVGTRWVTCGEWDGGIRDPLFGLRVQVSGEGHINGVDLARILTAVAQSVPSILNYRYTLRDTIAEQVGHCSTYEELLSVPRIGVVSQKTVLFGLNTLPDAPIALRDKTGSIVYSGGEWRRTSIDLHAKAAGDVGDYRLEHFEYSMPVSDVEHLISDLLSLCFYSEDEVIQTAINIEGRNYNA